MAVGRWSLRIPYRAGLAKRLRYLADIYARYGGDGGGSSPCPGPGGPMLRTRLLGPGLQRIIALRSMLRSARDTCLGRVLAAVCPSFAIRWPSPKRGRRECRVRAAPAVSCAKMRIGAHEHTGAAVNTPTSPAQWLYGLLRALPGERILVCHRHRRDTSRKLGTSNGCQDHTTSPYASVQSSTEQKRPSHPIPTLRDDGQRPSSGMRRRNL